MCDNLASATLVEGLAACHNKRNADRMFESDPMSPPVSPTAISVIELTEVLYNIASCLKHGIVHLLIAHTQHSKTYPI